MNDHSQGNTLGSKKRKLGTSDFRKQCRFSCGSDTVIEHVLLYLLPRAQAVPQPTVRSESDESESDGD